MKNRIFNFGNVSLTLGLGVAVGSIIFVYKSKADQKEVKDSFLFDCLFERILFVENDQVDKEGR